MSSGLAARDAADPLASWARRFAKPPGVIYMDGNSLGLLCDSAEESLRTALEMWRHLAIHGWTAGPLPWFDLSRRASTLLAPLLGATPDDVMVGNSTTINLHQILATFYDPTSPRILIDALSFPSDRYAVVSHLRLRGRPESDLAVVPSADGLTLDEDRILSACRDQVGLAVLPAVVYTSGQLLDMAGLTGAARKHGVLIAWDCSHSAGVIPHQFRADRIDLAFGCSYKYLNGGPGAPGWLYVTPHLRDRLPGLAGWFGCDPRHQFAMNPEFQPAADAGRYLQGTPHVLSVAPLVGSLMLLNEVGIPALRAKSLELTELLLELAGRLLARHGVTLGTPSEPARRGGHITLLHPQAALLSHTLRRRGVIPDFRPPDRLRLAPAPLYTTFAECAAAIAVLEEILQSQAHLREESIDARVT